MRKLLLLTAAATVLVAEDRPIVLKTSTLFDGKGKTLHNTTIVVEGSKISRVGGAAPSGAITYDLTALTVSPGWIDTHSHISRIISMTRAAMPAATNHRPRRFSTSRITPFSRWTQDSRPFRVRGP
jgi:imidazolonepropionase-like amidohydrolase